LKRYFDRANVVSTPPKKTTMLKNKLYDQFFFRLAALLFLSMIVCACSDEKKTATIPPPDMDAKTLYQTGAVAYKMNCAVCHSSGSGSLLAPDLDKSPVVSAKNPAQLVNTILNGQKGSSTINGKKFSNAMPPLNYLKDEDIAAISTYIRAEFGGIETPPVQPAQVRALRN